MLLLKGLSLIHILLSYVTNAQIGDSTSEYFLRSLGVGNFDVCIVTIGGNFQSSLETTSLLKELGAKLVVSRAERDVQAKFLLRNGADEVVYPEKQLAKWAAIRYSSEHILDYIELQDDHAIMEVTIPPEWMDGYAWAMVLDDTGNIRWSYALPDALNHAYTTGEVAGLSLIHIFRKKASKGDIL